MAVLLRFDSIAATLIAGTAFGGTVAIVMILLGGYSAQVNPAVTLASVLAQLTKGRLLFPFLLFQVLGGVLGGLTLRGIFGSVGVGAGLGTTRLAAGTGTLLGIALEALGTFVLSTSALVVSRRAGDPVVRAFLVGGTLFGLIQVIGPLTGAGFNPARSLGPAVASEYLKDLPLYILGPMLGGALAGLAFTLVNRRLERTSCAIRMCA